VSIETLTNQKFPCTVTVDAWWDFHVGRFHKLQCNDPKPLWSSRLPIPIGSPHQLMKRSTSNVENFITHHQLQFYSASKFLIIKRFDRHNEVILFFAASWQTEVQSQKLGVAIAPLLQCRTAIGHWCGHGRVWGDYVPPHVLKIRVSHFVQSCEGGVEEELFWWPITLRKIKIGAIQMPDF